MSAHARLPPPRVGQVALIALFITSLVTAQLTATKVLAFGLPISLPVTGAAVVVPGAFLAYGLTFLASDCYTELYGRRSAAIMVNIGFAMNFVLLALVWAAIVAPAAEPESVNPEAFRDVLGASTNIVIASLTAYLISQNWDVYFFDYIRERTEGAHLWFRNIASTATSQAIDTLVFIVLAFYLIPQLIGIGPILGGETLAALLVGHYFLKLVIVGLDTPLVYLIVHAVRRWDQPSSSLPG